MQKKKKDEKKKGKNTKKKTKENCDGTLNSILQHGSEFVVFCRI